MDYQTVEFPYRRAADHGASPPARHPVVIVGAGPVGLALALDLASHGIRVVLLDNDHRLSTGSRAICFAKRTLEIFDRLGCGQRMVDKGVSWNVGRLFFRDEQIYSFDLDATSTDRSSFDGERPAFINLQQYYVEGYLAERALEEPSIELRWKHEVVGVTPAADHVVLDIATPEGMTQLAADWLCACDGSRSAVRRSMGLESKGRTFRDRFLIADVKMHAGFPAERWFWFDPPFHPNQSVLLHRQPDDVWRIDFQLGWNADPDEEKKPENIVPRVQALLGPDAEFTLEWASVYTFSCLRMDKFRVGRVLFAGDAAHGVSPFGARGANSGVQDADNLGWKLAAVLDGRAPDALLDSYASEREYAADENIRHSTRSTDFITPKSEISRLFRDAVLGLAKEHAFARSLVNSGRLSVPATLDGSVLNTADVDAFGGAMRPGAAAADAPLASADGVRSERLLNLLDRRGFTLVSFGAAPRGIADAGAGLADVSLLEIAPSDTALPGAWQDIAGRFAERYDARPGSAWLLRPDQHVCARWRAPDAAAVRAALARALGRS
ncbi:MAG: FAD-dependent oxidoreductase [Proteobacteria bacterium]|nr:FAD-dependent oxidoreductase [Pseudomonadota bacterium]